MKTTVHIADALLAEVQTVAAREKTTLRALVEEGLRKVVNARQAGELFKLRDASVDGDGLRPELKEASWEAIRDIIYEGHGS